MNLNAILQGAANEVALSRRSYSLIIKDFQTTLSFVHPNSDNLNSFGSRYFELITRSCVEFEILSRRIFEIVQKKSAKDKNISELSVVYDYIHASDLEVLFCDWDDGYLALKPLFGWKENPHSLNWFRAYNKLKHDRYKNYHLANLENTIYSISALFLMITNLTKSSYNTMFVNELESGREFVFFDPTFSILAPHNWSPPDCLDGIPDAP